ncbi:hypothetical protein MANI_008935 [Metarhizium anisopliae]|uniref:Uncharacterized protein n=2 Tax=Metarhizium TaxID=5529 RepID=A0A0D9NRH1_METAN
MPKPDSQQMKIAEIQRLENAIDESIAWINQKEIEMQQLVAYIESLPRDARQRMSDSGSGSRMRRGKRETATADDALALYNRRVIEMEEAIRQQWLKLEDLKEQKRRLQ